MSFKVVLVILVVLATVCVFLFVSVIFIKLRQIRRERQRNDEIKFLKPILRKFFAEETVDFFRNHIQGISKLAGRLKEKSSFQTLESILLDILEDSEGETKVRARTIAYQFGFPDNTLFMIRDRLTGNIAIGCRKAGLYNSEEAIPDILKTLDILSSNTQFQALMALARIGDSATMAIAFDKINPLIFVNERAVNEMLNIFRGDRLDLFRKMIHHKSDYLVRLFIKAIDKETANELIEDIILIHRKGNKETRLACIVAIGRSGNSRKNYILINAMRDKEWEIRAMAAKLLGDTADPDAIGVLAAAARDREWWVRQNAVTSILSFPNREEILISITQTGDKYAFDSMQYTLGKANEINLLARIREIKLLLSSEQVMRHEDTAEAASKKRGSQAAFAGVRPTTSRKPVNSRNPDTRVVLSFKG